MIAIAEPVSRPTYIHEYVLTPYSLYAAVSVGLTKEDIFQVLDRLSKNAEIPGDVKAFIEQYSSRYGKAKLVLKDNRYFIEVANKTIKRSLLEIQQVKQAFESQQKKNEAIERFKREMADKKVVEESQEARSLRERLTGNTFQTNTSTKQSTMGGGQQMMT